MFPPGEGKVALARQVVDVRDEWTGDLYLPKKFCLFLTGEAPSERQLERQVHGVRTLLVAYGPNQAVLVNPQGDPQAHGFQYRSIPTTLEACLTLPYITEHIVVHGVKNPHRIPGFYPFSEFKRAYWTPETYYKNDRFFEGL